MTQCFVETIKVMDGVPMNLSYHQARLERTFRHFFVEVPPPSLEAFLSSAPTFGLCKARVVYGSQGIKEVQYAPYALREIRTLRIVRDNKIDYSFKSTDRTGLNRLAAQKEECDEIIILRNGLVTDTSFSNIAVFDGKRWITPRRPLLMGVKRACLLEKSILQEADITLEDLMKARKVSLINAMMELGELEVAVENIRL